MQKGETGAKLRGMGRWGKLVLCYGEWGEGLTLKTDHDLSFDFKWTNLYLA